MQEIIVKVPGSHKAFAAAMQGIVDQVVRFTADVPRQRSVDYRAHEVAVAEGCAAIEREAHGISLAALDVDAVKLKINGVVYHRVGRHEARYKTRAGEVGVERTLYRPSGGRGKRAVNTVTLRCGAVADEWLPDTASAMAHRLARGTSREAEQASAVERTLPYSRSSFEKLGHVVGLAMRDRRVDIEEVLIAEMEIPKGAVSASVALDRTTVPMEEPRPRRPGRRKKGEAKNPIEVVYRMGWCGTITLHDAKGDALDTIRYGRMPHEDGEDLAEALASDALALVKRRPTLKIVTLGDGAGDVQALLQRHVDEESFKRPLHRLVDFWHVIEKISDAADVMTSGTAKAELIADWRRRLCMRRTAVATILDELRASGKEHVRVGDGCPVHDAITYFENQGDLMDYVTARELGLPIGSGNVEATCKSLFGLRFKRPGARWHNVSGEDVVTMRAHQLSNRWTRASEIALTPPRVEVLRAA
ncbi:MAG: ISKra4-like element ISMfu2 family transposase [Gemmatimonadaceae bacterium]